AHISVFMIPPPPTSPPFPYTPLFRSPPAVRLVLDLQQNLPPRPHRTRMHRVRVRHNEVLRLRLEPANLLRQLHQPPPRRIYRRRSEEHTSELQSRENLVCRLLLEKKK